jgi:hypothetical protein
MSMKAIPNGDFDFATMAQAFVRTVAKDPARFEIAQGDAEQLDVAVNRYKAALQACRQGTRSAAATRAKEDSRLEAEQIIRRLRHIVRLNRKIDAATKILLGIRERTSRPKVMTVPQAPPRLRFVRALHESNASPMHELAFSSMDFKKGRPEGAARLELFVDLIPPEEPIPNHPGANHGGRPWYLRSYTRSPIVLAPPMPRVPMRILYWGRWADAAGAVGPFSATCAGWVEGGSHRHLPGAVMMQMGKPAPKLLEEPVLPSREQKYSVAVLEVHCQSFAPTLTVLPEPRPETRQLEGPAESEAA